MKLLNGFGLVPYLEPYQRCEQTIRLVDRIQVSLLSSHAKRTAHEPDGYKQCPGLISANWAFFFNVTGLSCSETCSDMK
jgi:hypothetical protein